MKAIGYEDYQGPRLTRQQQLQRMRRVIENELTEKQRRAVLGYYIERKNMPTLAREFGVHPAGRKAAQALPEILSAAQFPEKPLFFDAQKKVPRPNARPGAELWD